MSKRSPLMVLIAGPNGSGKSTIRSLLEDNAFGYIPQILINADEIKGEEGISNEAAQAKAFEEIDRCLKFKESFVFETVFSHISKLMIIEQAKQLGFKVKVLFVLTSNPKINIQRVNSRVEQGGHDVPEEKIVSRYKRSLSYIPHIIKLVDSIYILDNTNSYYDLLYHKGVRYKTNIWLDEAIKCLVEKGENTLC